MIRPKAVIIAESVIQDRLTNRMSLININEQFRSPGYPLLLSGFSVFSIIERDSAQDDPQTIETRLTIRLDQEVIFDQRIAVNFEDSLLNRNIMQFQGFVLSHPGTLVASVQVGNEILDSYRISVMPGPMPPPEQIQPPPEQIQ